LFWLRLPIFGAYFSMNINFNPFDIKLPVTEIIPAVSAHLSSKNTLVVSAPPGAGKSTLLPLALLNDEWLDGKKIIILEPRRLAASSIAYRMASLLGEPVGKTVGYRIRFENKVSAQTRIEVVTEGILTRMLHSDNALENVGLVIFDEFHERSIHADIALALCRESQQILRPDLRIMVMSATLDVGKLAEILKADVIESKGSMYPVEVIYAGNDDSVALHEACSRLIQKALREKKGDLLAFLPGQAEIRRCEEILNRQLKGIMVYPLYGQLSNVEQQAAIMPDPQGGRKVVLATSIAETSLTIEGIKIVVDSGFRRSSTFDPRTGLSGLQTLQVSVDSADQRAGRAGRLSAGACYRMWTMATQLRLAPYRVPEILEADLAPLVLDMLQWGVNDILSLSWLTPPPQTTIERAKELLEALNALKNGKITRHGKRIHALPCHPRVGNMLLMAEASGKLPLATDVAALVEERDPLDNYAGVDFNLRVEALRRYRAEGRREKKWENIEKVAAIYRKLFGIQACNDAVGAYDTGLLLAFAYPERIAAAKQDYNGQFLLANGRMAAVAQDDNLSHEQWLAISQLDARKGLGKIYLAAPVNPLDLLFMARQVDNISWDTRRGGLIASTEWRIGSVVVQSRPLKTFSEMQLTEVISKAVEEEGESLLNFDEDVEQWQNRIMSLRTWNNDGTWPDVSTAALLKNNREWLWPYFAQIKKPDDFKKINLAEVLKQSLDYSQQLLLNELAPEGIIVPSGSFIKLRYFAHGENPVLAVRLQEIFGMIETPVINLGKNGVIIHLLSPGFKPVQVTSDLKSFWSGTYFEVRKELKRRYPKHSWPESPLTAEAVRGVKRK